MRAEPRRLVLPGDLAISVQSDVKQTVLRLQARAGREIALSTSRALNKTAITVRAEASKKIRERYNLKARVIKAQMKIYKASPRRLFAQIIATGRRIPLIEFGATAVNPWNIAGRPHRRGGGGVRARVLRARTLYRGAFIATMPSGHRGVFTRGENPRLPIRQLVGISVPKAMAERAINAALIRLAKDRFRTEFERDLRFRMGA
jgi:hypothetical protein